MAKYYVIVSRYSYREKNVKVETKQPTGNDSFVMEVELSEADSAFVAKQAGPDFWLKMMAAAAQHGHDFPSGQAIDPRWKSDHRRFIERHDGTLPILRQFIAAGQRLRRLS